MSRTAALRARSMILCVSCLPAGIALGADPPDPVEPERAESGRAVDNQTLRWQTAKLAEFWGWNKMGVTGARGPARARTLFALYNEGERPKDPVVCMRLDDGAPVAALNVLPAAFSSLTPDDFRWRVAVVAADGLLAVPAPAGPGVVAYEPCTMRERWTFPLGPDDTVLAMTGAADTLVVAVGHRGPPRPGLSERPAERWRLMFIDGASGRLQRASPIFEGPPPDRLLRDGDNLLAFDDALKPERSWWSQTAVDMHLAAFSVATGRRLWHQSGAPAEITVGGRHLVVIRRHEQEIRVFDLATGGAEARIPAPEVWTHQELAVAADQRRLYYAVRAAHESDQPDVVVAFDLPTGKQRWRRQIPLAPDPDLTIERDAVYVGTTGYFVTALDVDSGRSRWRWGIGRAFQIVQVPPAAAAGAAAVPPLVVADSAGGLWRFARASRAVPVKPVVISGRVRVGDDDDSTDEDHYYGLTVGPKRVTTDRRGRFHVVLREPGAIRLAVADTDHSGLYWRRDAGGEADRDAVIVRPGGPAGPRRWLDLRTTVYYEDCH
jgi:outer membrane protein assembly factor BamB